jgi:putative membrane protein
MGYAILDYLHKKSLETKVFIVLFYVVGTVCMLVPLTFPLFVQLIPFALIISFLALLVFQTTINYKKTALAFIVIYILGLTIEIAGVNTGAIFGNYMYTGSLGITLLNTPIIIGLNWLILVYITASLFENAKLNTLTKIILASLLMVAYDIILEQVAPKLNMWRFSNDIVPYQNYIAWFAVSIVLQSVLKAFKINTVNKLALVVFISQLIFFLTLAFFLKL